MKLFFTSPRRICALIFSCVALAVPAQAGVFTVSPGANLAATLREIRRQRHAGKILPDEPVRIVLQGGIYRLMEPLRFQADNAGMDAGPLIIEAAPGELPVLSGGVEISRLEIAG